MSVDKNSAAWKTIRSIAVLVFVGFSLWLNASIFDATEIKSLIYTALAIAGWELGIESNLIKNLFKRST